MMLEIQNLHVRVEETPILKGLDLTLEAGQVHAVMGPNGAGKSTLGWVLSGRDGYEVTDGDILYKGDSILEWSPEKRSVRGIFLAFQYPVEIPGVSNTTFLKEALNATRRARGEKELDAMAFVRLLRAKIKELGMSEEIMKRAVNTGFSGGEKKRNEILQLSMLEPSLAILDETDSGLDIDALRIVAEEINRLRAPGLSMLVITHYQRLLDHIVPDKIHVMVDGRIVETGGAELALKLEETGYATVAKVG